MRILRITVKNLASLAGLQTVDFTREPLLGAGLFSISGATGSGKSTLLDALCLALYERTPRLSAASGIKIPDLGKEITQKDPGNLLRRGTSEGLAEVAFVGADKEHYTARWSIRRARNKATGALQDSEMTLYAGNIPPAGEGVIVQGGKKTEVLPAIAARVGIGYEQFSRAVLLAQNDFSFFLKADDRERAALLQTLTGTERFEQISRQVFQRNKEAGDRILMVEAELRGAAPLDAEARAQAEENRRKAGIVREEREQEVKRLKEMSNWLTREAELAESEQQAQQQLQAAEQKLQDSQARRQQLRLIRTALAEAKPLEASLLQETEQLVRATSQRDKARDQETLCTNNLNLQKDALQSAERALNSTIASLEQAVPALNAARELDAQAQPLGRTLETCEDEGREASKLKEERQKTVDALERELDRLRRERETRRAEAAGLDAYRPLLQEHSLWCARLDQLCTTRGEDADADKNKQTAEKELADQKLILEEASAGLDTLEAALRDAGTVLQDAEKSAAMLNPESLAEARRELEAEAQRLDEQQRRLERICDLNTQFDALRRSLKGLRDEEAGRSRRCDELQSDANRGEGGLETLKESLREAEAAASASAEALRKNLRPGKACPVCGSLEHPHGAHITGADLGLQLLREQENRKRAELTKLQTELSTLREQSRRCLKDQETCLADLSQCESGRSPLLADWTAQSPGPNGATPESALSEIRALLEQLKERRSALELREAEQRKASRGADNARERMSTARAARELGNTRLLEARGRLETARQASAFAAEQMRKAKAALSERQKELSPLFASLPGSAPAFETDAAAFMARFRENGTKLLRLTQALESCEQAIKDQETARDAALQLHKEAATRVETATKRETEARGALETLREKRRMLLGGHDAAEFEKSLRDQQTNCDAALNAARTKLAEFEQAHAAALERHRAAAEAHQHTQHRLEEARQRLKAWLDRSSLAEGQPLDGEVLKGLLAHDEAWLRKEEQALSALVEERERCAGARSAHTRNLETHRSLRPEGLASAEDLKTAREQELAALAEAHAAELSAEAILEVDNRCRATNAALLQKLETERSAASPWARLNELIGSADGAKFRGIAQRRTLDILLGYANAQLDQLAGRYRLERLEGSLNLIIVDRDMADERRSIHSLSGGESFLVSLALALGLASLSSKRLRIESLFIDEGFGSLDRDTLDTALKALNHLESQGRKVGVISHVTEMAETIPVQIKLVRGRSGSSRIELP